MTASPVAIQAEVQRVHISYHQQSAVGEKHPIIYTAKKRAVNLLALISHIKDCKSRLASYKSKKTQICPVKLPCVYTMMVIK